MQLDAKALRIEGIYQQKDGRYMQRVKLASGLLSVRQAARLAELGQKYGSGTLHLTTRGSLEFHDLTAEQLPLLQRGMAEVGLFSRGACGGAVRGISCSTGFGSGFNYSQVLGRKLLLHFSGNPRFEGLPKKFKIAVEADYHGSRHLIQDLALVFVDHADVQSFYDVWLGGGLGRAPQAAILYRERVAESELLPLIEAVIQVYRDNVEPPKRLKTLVAKGEGAFRELIAAQLSKTAPAQFNDAFDKSLLPVSAAHAEQQLQVPVFAGELPATQLAKLTDAARQVDVAYLLVTSDQDLALLPETLGQRQQLVVALEKAGFVGIDQPPSVCRVCPGNHECAMGLAATRDLAELLKQQFGDRLQGRSIAISGCGNSCAQPQLAEFGILASKSVKGEDGQRSPRFDLYRRQDAALGQPVAEQLSEAELLQRLEQLL